MEASDLQKVQISNGRISDPHCTPLIQFVFRNHPLAREADIVETLHMRLTLLQMTFGKHIERKHVCFFAGEVSKNYNYRTHLCSAYIDRVSHFSSITKNLFS